MKTLLPFWSRWLEAIAGLFVLLSLFIGLGNQSGLFRALFDSQAILGSVGPAALNPELALFKGYVYGVLGGTMMGYGLLAFFVARFGFARGEKWAWIALLLSTLLWYALDTGGSLKSGVVLNAAGNTLFLALLLVPLIVCARAFFPKTDARA
jgi:hypothetical protein